MWRRTVYSYWKRTSPPTGFQVLDGPTRETCVLRRTRTNTPLQALLLLNDETFVVSARALLEMKWEEAKRKFQEGRVPMPSFWGGFRVVPCEMEFWQGRGHRLHDRFLYTRQPDGSWKRERLSP